MWRGTENANEITCALGFPHAARWGMVTKRVLDFLGATIAIGICLPLFVLIAILIRATSPGPVFFHWNVVGQGGKPFVGYKFRTMLKDADRMRDDLQARNEMTGVFFKMKRDPRVTSIGRILRQFSLDELPQLWSVLKGDMSLVGPRPTQVFEHEQLKKWQKQRVQVKPGAFSLWIVSGKTQDFDEMVRLDLQYIQTWSVWLDLKILLKTFPYVVLGKNY
jgi:lipopolysaccharide/colanic/teichoic acid biosynthesis glycosyltransferase